MRAKLASVVKTPLVVISNTSAVTVAAARKCRAVEIAIWPRGQARLGIRPVGAPQADQRSQFAVGGHLKHCAITVWSGLNASTVGASLIRCAVEITTRLGRQARIRTGPLVEGKADQSGERAVGRHFIHRSVAGAATFPSHPIQIAVGTQRQRSSRIRPIAIGKGEPTRKRTVGRNLKERANAAAAASGSSTIEIAIWSRRQARVRVRPIRVGIAVVSADENHTPSAKRIERSQRAVGCNRKHGATATRAARTSRAIKIAVEPSVKAAVGLTPSKLVSGKPTPLPL